MEIRRATKIIPLAAILCLGFLLAGCGDPAANSSSEQATAQSQFLADRSGGSTPGTTDAATTAQNGRAPGVFGTIEKIDGNNLTITSTVGITVTAVQISASTVISKQVAAQLSDLTQGQTVTATGAKNGDVLEAASVQIGAGGFGGFGGGGAAGRGGFGGGFTGTPGAGRNRGNFSGTPGSGFGGGAPGANGTPGPGANGRFPGANGTPGAGGNFVAGTVQKVDGSTVTVQATDGTTSTFTVSSTTRLLKQASIQASDLQVGNSIVATGTQNATAFDATSIQVTTAFARATPTP